MLYTIIQQLPEFLQLENIQGCPKSDSTASSLVFKKAKSLYFQNVYSRINYTRAVKAGQSVPLGLYSLHCTNKHGTKLAPIRVTVNLDTRKVELSL